MSDGDPVITTTYKSVSVKYTHYGTWNFYASFALSFGYRAIPTLDKNCKVVRIWFDNVLVYDAYANLGNVAFIFYPGTEDQPFYRGQMVLFFTSVHLADQSHIPAVTAEIVDSTDLSAVIGATHVSREGLAPAWADYSPELASVVQMIDVDGMTAFRRIVITTNSDNGMNYFKDASVDTSAPIIFMPWYSFALAQNGAQKVLINTSPTIFGPRGIFGTADHLDAADYLNLPPSVMGIAQNAGATFSASSSFFVLASDEDDDSKWPYQVLYVNNNDLVFGGGINTRWDDEPVCMARGFRQGAASSGFRDRLLFSTPPITATGDVLVAFDKSVRKLTIGVAGFAPISRADALVAVPPPADPNKAGKITDALIYSFVGAGNIVRIHPYLEPLTGQTSIIILIERDAINHIGVVRKIAYDGTVAWTSDDVQFDAIENKQHRIAQASSDLSAGKLGIISYHTPGAYTVVDLADGSLVTGSWDTGALTVDATYPAFWISGKETFYPSQIDSKFMRVDVPGVTAIPLDDALTDLAVRAGYAADDVICTGLHDTTIQGYIIGANTTLGAILNNMGMLYQFSYAEIGEKLFIAAVYDGDDVFNSVVSLTQDDLAVLTEQSTDDQQIVNTVIADDASMPLSLTVNYIDPDIDYQQGTQTARRTRMPTPTTQSSQSSSITIPIIAHGDEMLLRLYRALYDVWASQKSHSIRLPTAYLKLIPTDGFTFSALGFDHRVTTVSVTLNADYSVSLSLAERSPSTRSVDVDAQLPSRPAPRGPVAPIRALLLDIPNTSPAQDAEDNLNLGVALSGYAPGLWLAGRLDMSIAGDPSSWATRMNTTDETPIGTVLTITVDHPLTVTGPLETDYNTTIKFAWGSIDPASFTAATYDEMLDGANLIVAGRDGRFELMQFGEVTDNLDGTGTIRVLFRGRFGTEQVIPMLSAGDYLMTYGSLKAVTYPLADFVTDHRAYVYRGVVPGQEPEDATQALIIPSGISQRPRAPVHLRLVPSVDDDENPTYDLRFQRRERFGGELVDGTADIPQSIGRVFSVDLWRADQTGISLRTAPKDMGDDSHDHYVFTANDLTTAGYDLDALDGVYAYAYQVDLAGVGRGWGGGFFSPFLSDDPYDVPVVEGADAVVAGAMRGIGSAGAIDSGTPDLHAAIGGAMRRAAGSIEIDSGTPNPAAVIAGALKHMGASIAVVETDEAAITGAMGKVAGSIVGNDASIDADTLALIRPSGDPPTEEVQSYSGVKHGTGPGVSGNAMTFVGGSGDRYEFTPPDSVQFSIPDAWTLEFHTDLAATSAGSVLARGNNGDNGRWACYATGSSGSLQFYIRSGFLVFDIGGLFDGSMHHFAITENLSGGGRDYVMFKDGVSQGTARWATDPTALISDDLWVGNDPAAPTAFQQTGSIGRVKMSQIVRYPGTTSFTPPSITDL